MKMYITSRFFKPGDDPSEIDDICSAVQAAGYEAFHAVRDMRGPFDSVVDLWIMARKMIEESDVLLIDISDNPSGGRLVEVGIAFALNKPIFVIVKGDVQYKQFFDAVATKIIRFQDISEIAEGLK